MKQQIPLLAYKIGLFDVKLTFYLASNFIKITLFVLKIAFFSQNIFFTIQNVIFNRSKHLVSAQSVKFEFFITKVSRWAWWVYDVISMQNNTLIVSGVLQTILVQSFSSVVANGVALWSFENHVKAWNYSHLTAIFD